MGISIASIVLVSIFASMGVHAALNAQASAELKRRQQEADDLAAGITETTFVEETEPISESTMIVPMVAPSGETAPVMYGDGDSTQPSSTTEETTETLEESTTTQETTAATTTTAAPTTTTTAGFNETPYYSTVYASQNLNLRSGPGVEYDVVRMLNAGDGIDVIAQTDTGWYKTYSGNYVLSRYTQTSRPTTATTAAATTAAQPTAAQTTASSSSGGGDISGMTYYGTCTITFYGPQPRGDGTYSTTTATGTTCSQGRTCAADWSIFPAGTTIYVANDPLGGDGYYTVEDKGGAVKGSHIDIYADNGESFSTTSREVYIVN